MKRSSVKGARKKLYLHSVTFQPSTKGTEKTITCSVARSISIERTDMNADMIIGFVSGILFLATMIGIAEAIGVGDYNDTCSKESDCEDTGEGLDVLPGSVPSYISERREHHP